MTQNEKWAKERQAELRPLSPALAEVFRIVEDLERCARLLNCNDAAINAAFDQTPKIQ